MRLSRINEKERNHFHRRGWRSPLMTRTERGRRRSCDMTGSQKSKNSCKKNHETSNSPNSQAGNSSPARAFPVNPMRFISPLQISFPTDGAACFLWTAGHVTVLLKVRTLYATNPPGESMFSTMHSRCRPEQKIRREDDETIPFIFLSNVSFNGI